MAAEADSNNLNNKNTTTTTMDHGFYRCGIFTTARNRHGVAVRTSGIDLARRAR
jgi:hypothetical protein